MSVATTDEPVLRISSLSKTFPGTLALDDVSIDIRRGEIHALMGQNGSGKSTLIKCLASYHQPDPGAIAELDGESFDIGHTVPDGLRFVHQDLGLVLELNALDNLALHGGSPAAPVAGSSGASKRPRRIGSCRASPSISTFIARSLRRRRSSAQ